MTLKEKPVKFPESDRGERILLMFEMVEELRPDFFRLVRVKGWCPQDITHQTKALVKKTCQETGLHAKGVFAVKAGNISCHVCNLYRKFAGAQIFCSLWQKLTDKGKGAVCRLCLTTQSAGKGDPDGNGRHPGVFPDDQSDAVRELKLVNIREVGVC